MSEVTIEATDPLGNSDFTFVPVIVAPTYINPTASPIPGQTVTSGTQPTLVDLWKSFNDRLDGSYLNYTIASDSNAGLFNTAPSIDSNGFLSLESFQSSDSATFTIKATDAGGLSVTSDPFTVTAAAASASLSTLTWIFTVAAAGPMTGVVT